MAAGSAERTRASPTSAPSKPCGPPAPISPASRTPDSATTSRSSGTSSRSRDGPLGVDVERAEVAVVDADRSGRRSRRPLDSRASWASTSGSRPISRAGSTSRASALAFVEAPRAGGRGPPPPHAACGSWIASTTNSLARTGRRDGGPHGAQVVDRAAEPVRLAQDGDRAPRRRPRRRAPGRRCPRPPPRSRPADGEERLISAMTCRPGAARASTTGAAAPRRRQGRVELVGQARVAADLGGSDVGTRRRAAISSGRPASAAALGRVGDRHAGAAATPRRPPRRRALRAEAPSSPSASPASIVRAARSTPVLQRLDPAGDQEAAAALRTDTSRRTPVRRAGRPRPSGRSRRASPPPASTSAPIAGRAPTHRPIRDSMPPGSRRG